MTQAAPDSVAWVTGSIRYLRDDPVDAAVEGRGEEQPLAADRDHVEQLGDGRQEAHLGHVVGLVEHGDLDLTQVAGPALDQVGQPAGRGDDELGAALQAADLLGVGHAAGDEPGADPEDVGQRQQRVVDLHRQLAGRHQDEGQRLARLGGAALEPGQHRQAEGQRLAGAGLAAAEDVAAGERVRDGRGLDRERLVDAVAAQPLDQRVGQAERGEGHARANARVGVGGQDCSSHEYAGAARRMSRVGAPSVVLEGGFALQRRCIVEPGHRHRDVQHRQPRTQRHPGREVLRGRSA